jgi:LmbE family N-acetylglucosaminyl deacetylase
MALDYLVFGPHPDDAEIGAGALLRKMKALGHATGIVDMTTGDMGWGTPEQRLKECADAARILQLDVRENLDLGDGRIEDTLDNRCAVAGMIRKHQPQIVMAPYYNLPIGRGLGHNDHYKTGQIVSNAFNLAHLRKAPVPGEVFQARALFYYFLPPGQPTFIIDITSVRRLDGGARRRRQASSTTPIAASSAAVGARDHSNLRRFWGWQIGVKYGQAFLDLALSTLIRCLVNAVSRP